MLAELQRDKRTRAAARDISELRLEAAAEALRAGFFEPERGIVEIATPRLEVVPGTAGGRVRIEVREP